MFRPALPALLALASPLSAQEIWTVDDDGPADFASLQAAADFAADGDTLVVRDGTYGSLVVQGKGLTIQAGGDAIAKSAGTSPIRVAGLGPQQEVLVRGFEFKAGGQGNGAPFASIALTNCLGPVLIEDCRVDYPFGIPAVIEDCTSATFVDCTLLAAQNYLWIAGFFLIDLYRFPGLVAEGSGVYLYECIVQGGAGSTWVNTMGEVIPATAGNPAVSLVDSTVLASGCVFTGGKGGDSDPWYGQWGYAMPGGDGVVLIDSEVNIIECALTGGAGGLWPGFPGWQGDGAPFVADAESQLIQLPGNARSFRTASPVSESSPLPLHFEGDPGDAILVHVALGIAPGLLVEPLGLALHLTWPYTVFPFGALPASGVLDLSLPTPALPPLPGYEHILFTAQALFVATDGGLFDGGPRTVLITSAQL